MCYSPTLRKGVPLLCLFKTDCHDAKLPSDLQMSFCAESIKLSFNHALPLKRISLSEYFLKYNYHLKVIITFIHVVVSVTIFWSWLSSGTLIICGFICFLQYTRSIINHEYSCGERINQADLQFQSAYWATSIATPLADPNAAVIFCQLTFIFPLKVDFGRASTGCIQSLGRKRFPLNSIILNLQKFVEYCGRCGICDQKRCELMFRLHNVEFSQLIRRTKCPRSFFLHYCSTTSILSFSSSTLSNRSL